MTEEKSKPDEKTKPEEKAKPEVKPEAEEAKDDDEPVAPSKDTKPVMDRFVTFLKGVGSRVQFEGGRAWMITNLRLEIAKIKRQRQKKIREIGERTFEMLVANALKKDELMPLHDEVVEMDKEVSEREAHIDELEKQDFEEQKKAEGGEEAVAEADAAKKEEKKDA